MTVSMIPSALSLHNKDLGPPICVVPNEEHYVEGTTVKVICINFNAVYLVDTFWLNPNGALVGSGGIIEFIAMRNQTGLYTCVTDDNGRNKVPTVSFTLVVHCKL